MRLALILEKKLPRRLIGALLAALYAYAAASVLIKMNLPHALSDERILQIIAITISIYTVVFYNKLTLGISLALAVACGIWYHFTHGIDYLAMPNAAGAFIGEVVPAMRSGEALPLALRDGAAYALCVAAALFACCTAARLAGVYTLSITMLLVCGLARILGGIDVMRELCAAAVVILATGAASYGRVLAYRQAQDSEGDETGGTSGLALLAIPIALLFMLLMPQLYRPEIAQTLRAPRAVALLDDAIDYFAASNPAFTRRRTIFSLSAVGFGSAAELGGPVSLSDEVTLLVQSDTRPDYLRGTVRAVYTGVGWQNQDTGGSYRFGSPIWSDEQREIFDLDRPDPVRASAIFSTTTYTVTALRHYGTIFTPLRATAISSDANGFIPYFNTRGELFPKELFAESDVYTVTGLAQRALSDTLREALVQMEGTVSDTPAKLREIEDEYLPKITNSDRLYVRVAKELAENTSGKMEAALRIRDWLRDYCVYTLTPAAVPKNVDFIDYFLETRAGYCVYYASAMAQMARAVGIPARYVEGYLLSDAERNGDTYTVRGTNAHAWAELYFDGIGWLIFDATGFGETGGAQPQTVPQPSSAPPSARPTAQAVSGAPDTAEAATPPPADAVPPPHTTTSILRNCGLIILLLLAALTAAAYAMPLLRAPARLAARLGGDTHATRLLWRRIEDLLPFIDRKAVRGSGETALRFAARVDPLPTLGGITFAEVVDAAMRAYYAGSSDPAHLAGTYAYYAALDAHLRRRFTPPVWAAAQLALATKILYLRRVAPILRRVKQPKPPKEDTWTT